jgi:hypothetical protein
MTDLVAVPQQTPWHKLRALVLDSVSSRLPNDSTTWGWTFFSWFGLEPRAGFTKPP